MVMKVREEKKRVLREQLDIIEAEKSRVCATICDFIHSDE